MKLFSAVFFVFLLLPIVTLKSMEKSRVEIHLEEYNLVQLQLDASRLDFHELSAVLKDANEIDDNDIENLINAMIQDTQEDLEDDEPSDEEFPPSRQPRKKRTSCALF